MKTFKVLSALLSYPTQDLIDAAPEFPAILDAEKVVPAARRGALDLLIEEIAIGELYDLQERYGLLFDRSKTLALHLFEHVHGESRDRGQAMVDLKAMYDKAGLLLRGILGGQGSRGPSCDKHVNLQTNQLGCQRREPTGVTVGRSIFDDEVLPLNVSQGT